MGIPVEKPCTKGSQPATCIYNVFQNYVEIYLQEMKNVSSLHAFSYIQYLFLSLCGTHKHSVLLLWLLVAALSLCVSFFLLTKPGEGAPAPQPSCSPSPHAHSCQWVVFSSPACRSSALVPSATCDSSSTWPSLHPQRSAGLFPPQQYENTPQQAWQTCHVSSLSQANNPKWLP